MNNYDTDAETKVAAQSLIEAMHGLTVGVALDVIGKLELSRIQTHLYMPQELERYTQLLKGLPTGSALNACRIAAHMIRERTFVQVDTQIMQQHFAVWQSEAAIENAWKAAHQ